MSFRVSNEQTLGEVVRELIGHLRLEDKLKEVQMVASWESVVGQLIASHTTHVRIHKRVLYVEVDSAALRNELMYSREKLRKALNIKAKDNLIDEIIVK